MFKFVMAIIQKGKDVTDTIKKERTKSVTSPLTVKEVDFILNKLNTAEYKGYEFEMYYNAWVKLNDLKKTLK